MSIRVLHHWACSGGTLISKCIAAHQDTLLLSEIHPYSYIRLMLPEIPAEHYCHYGNILQQLSLPQNGADPLLCLAYFNGSIAGIYGECIKLNKNLVLRSHSHIDFFVGAITPKLPVISSQLRRSYELLELISVRHPLDSWLSLKAAGWDKHFRFSCINEYCKRCLVMLEACYGMPLIYYEHFCLNPTESLHEICEVLNLPYDPASLNMIGEISMTGSSGRTSNKISPRERREIPKDIETALLNSPSYITLCERLKYDHRPTSPHPYTLGVCTNGA